MRKKLFENIKFETPEMRWHRVTLTTQMGSERVKEC